MSSIVTSRLVGIAAAALLAACSLAPPYERPAAPVAADWPSGPAYAARTAKDGAAADIAWQDFFVDEHLRELIALALANNRDLRVAVLNIEKARALYQVQRADLFPTIERARLDDRPARAGGPFAQRRDQHLPRV